MLNDLAELKKLLKNKSQIQLPLSESKDLTLKPLALHKWMKRTLQRDLIYVRACVDTGKKDRIKFHFGKDIADLLEFKCGKKVAILADEKLEVFEIFLHENDINFKLFSLCESKNHANTVFTTITCNNYNRNMTINDTRAVQFEIMSDHCIRIYAIREVTR